MEKAPERNNGYTMFTEFTQEVPDIQMIPSKCDHSNLPDPSSIQGRSLKL